MYERRKPDPKERHVIIVWEGPFLLRDNQLAPHPAEPADLPGDKPGLYLVTSDFPLHGNHHLSYIGQSKNLETRVLSGHQWLKNEWRLELYAAVLEDDDLRNDVESLLIRAHFPTGNTQHKARSRPIHTPLRIWNYGRFWGLLPEVSSGHEWNDA